MKNLKLFVIAIALFSINATAADFHPIKPTDELRVEIVDMIGSDFNNEMMIAEHNEANVLFTVNSKKELIVLSVDTENEQLESYLKWKLNYKKVDYRPSKNGEIYLLPVKMVK